MLGKTCVERLQRDYRALCKEPVPQVKACPLPSNLLEWHYVLEGSENTPFAGGYYHGTLIFPTEFPFKPPSIRMITPNGRFATDQRLCLSISDFHPESWNPVWSVSSILMGLLSFMMDDKITYGSIVCTDEKKRQLAKDSLAHNCRSEKFRTLFPEYVEKYNQQKAAVQQQSTSDEQLQERQSSDPETANEGIVAIGVADQAVNQQHIEHHPANRRGRFLSLCLILVFLAFAVASLRRGLSQHRK